MKDWVRLGEMNCDDLMKLFEEVRKLPDSDINKKRRLNILSTLIIDKIKILSVIVDNNEYFKQNSALDPNIINLN